MKRLLTILLLIGLSVVTKSQSVRLPSGDSITYDFSGATRKGSPGLYKYFTANTADDGRITRDVADFNRDSLGGKGWRGMINFQTGYTLDVTAGIRYYDRSGSRDTIWLWFFGPGDPPTLDLIRNPQNYTPDYKIISCGTCSGLPVSATVNTSGETVQYAFVVVRRTNLFSGLWPNVSNISFWGTPTGIADTVYNLAHWAYNQWTAKPIDSIVGNYNIPNQQDTLWHDTATAVSVGGGYFRSFDQMFYDNEAVKHNWRIDLGGSGYSGYKYNAALARRGNYQFAAVFNDNAYFKFQLDSMGHGNAKSWGTNTVYDDPQLPESYSRKGYYMHAQALIGGGCTTCPDVRTYNGTLVKGQGFMKGMGSSNEPAWFFPNSFKNAIEAEAEYEGVYDSVKLGDPNMPLFAVGYEAYNYDDAKAFVMVRKLRYRSRNIKLDGVSFHGTHNLKADSFPVIPTSSQQIGNHGVSVGYNDDWRKNIHYVQGLRREAGNPNLLVQMDEDTHQKGVYKRYPTTDLETFTVSQLGAPRATVEGVTLGPYHSHGVFSTQDEYVATASPIYKHYWYQIVDDQLYTANPNYDGIDQSNGKFDRPLDFTDKPEAWPAYYATASRKLRLGRYKFVDSTYIVSRGLHVFKYRHVSADSTMYEFAVLDSTGTATYNLTGLPNGSAYLITPSFTSRQATQATVTISGGAYTLNADPLPRALIFYEEEGEPANQAPTAAAGFDQTITLPTSSVTVNGSSSTDPDGTISTYLWTKTSGPSGGTISSPNSASTNITGLQAGTYVFTLTVTDDDGAEDTDTITIVVNAEPSAPFRRVVPLRKKIKIIY